MDFVLRSPLWPADYAPIADLLNQVNPKPTTADELAESDADLPAGHILHRTLAVDAAGRVIGFGEAFRYPNTPRGKFYVNVIVTAGARGRGAGGALLAAVERYAADQGGNRFVGSVQEDDPGSLAWVEKRGYAVQRKSFYSTLDLTAWDGSRFAGVLESIRQNGIRLFPLAEAPGPNPEAKLYELMSRTIPDIPGYEAEQFMSVETWQNFLIKPAGPERVIIAADGDRFVGVTTLTDFEGGLYTAHTSVDREYRGRRIALGLKLAAIELGLRSGAAKMTTGNDALNGPMLAVNQKLGYVASKGEYEVAKRR